MADRSVFRTAVRTPSAQMDADFSTLHAPEAAGEVVDQRDGASMTRDRSVNVLRLSSTVLHVFPAPLPKRDSCESAV